jgi:hypothetical protein
MKLEIGNHKFTLDENSEDGLCLCGYGYDFHRDTDGQTKQEREAAEREKVNQYQSRQR